MALDQALAQFGFEYVSVFWPIRRRLAYDHTYIPVESTRTPCKKAETTVRIVSLRSLLLLSSHLPPPRSAHFASLVAGAVEGAATGANDSAFLTASSAATSAAA